MDFEIYFAIETLINEAYFLAGSRNSLEYGCLETAPSQEIVQHITFQKNGKLSLTHF